MKLFPAESIGGMRLLKSLAAPFREIEFCATGGINSQSPAVYLALPNVACIGGSWMVPQAAVSAHDWRSVSDLAAGARKAADR